MPAPDDLITYLVAAGVSEVEGVSLFVGPMPETPNACVVLTHYDGEPGLDRTMGPELQPPGAEVALVQLMVRNPKMATAQSKAQQYHGLLDSLGPRTISGRLYHNVESVSGEPFSLGQDANQRWRYVANYRAVKGRG